mmetsp:Transcript_26216/g.43037  ORF Transcript_26216/g.43037 Transcript_26216/m.43037 type:complete len:94 (-) Transcript_26216:88-369(-)
MRQGSFQGRTAARPFLARPRKENSSSYLLISQQQHRIHPTISNYFIYDTSSLFPHNMLAIVQQIREDVCSIPSRLIQTNNNTTQKQNKKASKT